MDLTIPTGSPDLLHDLTHDSVGCLSRLHRTCGNLVAFPKGSQWTVFSSGMAAGQAILSDPETFHVFGHPGSKNSAQRRFSLGFFGINGVTQQQHRRLLMPAVRKEVVEASIAPMTELTGALLDDWMPGRQIDLAGAMRELSLRVASRLLFGLHDFPVARKVAVTFHDWLHDYVAVVFALSLPVDLPSDRYQHWVEVGNELEGYLRQLIDQRRSTLRDGEHDLLALLLRAHEAGHITADEVIGEMQALFNASYQTTASALTWTVLLLLQHDDVLRRLQEEWQVSDGHGPRQEPLLERAIRESLRVLPPVVFVMRRSVRPSVVAGHRLPEGTIIFHNLYVTHHLADLFPDPQRFDPDRWLRQPVSPFAYAPFGAGPRVCMGALFALQLVRVAVPAILRRFRLALTPGTAINRRSNLTLGVAGPLNVTVHAPGGDRFAAVPLTGNIHEMVRLTGGVHGH